MKKIYLVNIFLFISFVAISFFAASCKKSPVTPIVTNKDTTATTATPATVGLYELDSSIYKILEIAVSKIGTSNIDYGEVFDTGSGGMVIDADSLVPASMIGPSGFIFSGDSTVVNGITITNQTSLIEYGADSATTDKVYGNLAYAQVTIGDQPTGGFVIKRLPFFLYYKAVDGAGNKFGPHEFDTFGVSDEYDVVFGNTVSISSPFSYYAPGTGLTKGFKMAALGTSYFSSQFGYSPSVITVGLTASDLSSSSGFTMNTLYFYSGVGYPPIIPATVTYNGKSFSAQVLFDTGTEPYSYLEDPTYNGNPAQLAANSSISIVTPTGFTYSYTTTATENLTNVENPNTTGGSTTIISLEYFINNEFLLDFTDHKLGVKVN
jgi:hypothetical protein